MLSGLKMKSVNKHLVAAIAFRNDNDIDMLFSVRPFWKSFPDLVYTMTLRWPLLFGNPKSCTSIKLLPGLLCSTNWRLIISIRGEGKIRISSNTHVTCWRHNDSSYICPVACSLCVFLVWNLWWRIGLALAWWMSYLCSVWFWRQQWCSNFVVVSCTSI